MGAQDYYLEGAWNFYCQECDRKWKSTEGRRRWDGFWVGPCCYEVRNPQDFIRGIPDNPSVPWSTHGFPRLPLDVPAIPTGDCVGLFPRGRFRLLNSWLLDSLLLDSPPVSGTVVTHSWLLQLNGSSILQLSGDHLLVS